MIECGTTISVADLLRQLFVDDLGDEILTCETQYLELWDLVRDSIEMGVDGLPVLKIKIT